MSGTDRASSSYLVWIDGRARVMVDVGGGAFLRFGQAGADLQTLDLLGISHFHPDYVSDLPALLWLSDNLWENPLRIAGPSGNGSFPSLDDFLSRLFDARSGAFQILGGTLGDAGRGVLLEAATIDVAQADAVTIIETPDLSVTALPAPHANVPSVAYRVESRDVSVVFSGDQTGENLEFVRFARDASTLVMHLALAPGAPASEFQATPTRVGEVARDSNVARLVVSHLFRGGGFSLSDLDGSVAEVSRHYAGPVSVSRDLI